MQTSSRRRPRSAPTGDYRSIRAAYVPEDNRKPVLMMGALCLLLPPVGALLIWRSKRGNTVMRLSFSALAVASMTLIFSLTMMGQRAASRVDRPVPVTPVQAGYGAYVAPAAPGQSQSAVGGGSAAPAPPSGGATVQTVSQDEADLLGVGGQENTGEDVGEDTGEAMTLDTVVFTLAEGGGTYHLLEVCDGVQNDMTMTLEEALLQGLEPCETCVEVVG